METPIIIDNGSYLCRAGFANEETPQLVFKNYVAKLRKERGKKEVEIQVGHEIENLDNVRFALKSQFDKNVVVHTDIQEILFDYLFSSLNINEDRINHPIVLSEAFLNPNYCRHLMAELLFECYQIPSIAYGTDALFSFKKNYPSSNDALIVSFGYRTIHVLPYLDNKVDSENSRRINLGGFEITSFLHRLLQLKYPAHTNFITFGKVEEMIHNNGYIAENYSQELEKWMDMEYYNKTVKRIELPKTAKAQLSTTQTESLKEKRKEIAKKMVEMNAKKREEKLAEDEERLEILTEIKNMAEDGDAEEIQRALKAAGIINVNELLKSIAILKSKIYKVKNRNKTPIETPTVTSTIEEPTAKIPKEYEKPQDKEAADEWITKMRNKRAEILKKRTQRRQNRTDMAKRRTKAGRFSTVVQPSILSQLARKEKHDTFGQKDEDWDVYKSTSREGGGSDTEEEQEELNELEQVLKRNDPNFMNELQGETKGLEDDHELHIGLEIVRATELMFQPSLIGETQGGVADAIEHVLKLYPDENIQQRLVSNVFLTGGLALCKGLVPRIERHLLEIRPFESSFKVYKSENPSLDAWFGMKNFALDSNNQQYFISRAEYDEKGGEYFKDHNQHSKYFPSPHVSVDVDFT